MEKIVVNAHRIQERLNLLASFGLNEMGGIDRNFGSEADLQVREVLLQMLQQEAGAVTRVDAAANIWASVNHESQLPYIAMGSHHDTVVNGGRYDGALGIVLAIEVLQVLQESGYLLRHPLTMVSFTAEEPNPFNLSTFGSRAVTGKLPIETIRAARDVNSNRPISDAVNIAGGDIDKLLDDRLKPESLSAFVECHIEQGKRLDKGMVSLAVVSGITGIYRETVHVCGEANHAGTTVMADRLDALSAAAAFCLAFESVLREISQDDVVGTIGRFNVSPNAVNIIPSDIYLTLEIRTPNPVLLNRVLKLLDDHVKAIENERKVKIKQELLLDQSAVDMDKTVMAAMSKAIVADNEKHMTLTSMAGHDATHMASITKAGMLFVRSLDGKSHCPDEESSLADIEKAGNALLKTILRLDKELD